MSKVAISKTASNNNTKQSKNPISWRQKSMGSIGNREDLLKMVSLDDHKKAANHFRIKTTHQLVIPPLKTPDIRVPIHSPKSLVSSTVRQFESGNYNEYLKYHAELEKKKEEADLLNKLITNKVENLAIALSGDRYQALQAMRRQTNIKPIETIEPISPQKIHPEPVRSPRLTNILNKVQKNMTSGGLQSLLLYRTTSPREPLSGVLKTKEDATEQEQNSAKKLAVSQVRFVEPLNPDPKIKKSKYIGATDFFRVDSNDQSEENKKFEKSVKERLISSIQTINNVNDSLKSYATTFLNQGQRLSEYRGGSKKVGVNGSNVNMSKKQAKTLLSKKFRKTIWFIYDKMKLLKLTMTELCTEKVFSSRPYEDPDAHTFFKYCKIGNTDGATQIVRWNKYIVHSYDETRKTGLHWAIKRKHNRIARMLLESGADPNALDLVILLANLILNRYCQAGRNPLFMAASADNLIGAKLLLQYRADPNKLTEGKRGILEYASSFRLKSMLEMGKEIFISMEFAPDKMKSKIWKLYGLPNYVVKDDEIDDY